MKKRAVAGVFAATMMIPAVAAAQSSGVGIGVNTTTDQPSLGVAIPIMAGDALRIEPGLFFAYQRVKGEQTNGVFGSTGTFTQSNTTLGLRAGIHSFFAQAGSARAFVGADLSFVWNEETESVEVENNGTTNTTESDTTTTGFSVTPVLGGEVAVAGNLYMGLRAGPQFVFLFPEVDDPDTQDASVFAINGMGRLDVTYYF